MRSNKKALLFSFFLSFSTLSAVANQKTEKEIIIEKLENLTAQYVEKIKIMEKKEADFEILISSLELELKALSITKEEIEIRKNIVKDLYVDAKDTENLYLLDFDETGDIKKEISEYILNIKESLNDDSKVVKIRLSNGKMLPLIKYKVRKNDTLKNILLHTYPKHYSPTWKEASYRIETLLKINKNVIKMNYIYPTQTIYIPLFKDNPSAEAVLFNIMKQEIKK